MTPGPRAQTVGRRLPAGAGPAPVLWVIFFLSGFAGLVYEVLWLRQLGLIFGVAAQAAATTLAVFFLGLAAGGLVWGRRARRLSNPLRTYGALEIGIAVSALLFFALHQAFKLVFPALYALADGQPLVLLTGKVVLSAAVLFPPAFFMGGTLPVMGQYMVRRSTQLGARASLLYLVNTAGAAAGSFAAGFLLPPLLGYRGSYLLAISLNLIVAAVAFKLAGDASGQPLPSDAPAPKAGKGDTGRPLVSARGILVLAGASGILTLAAEVLWTRMFSQVLQNSVYTYSLILTLFLLALAAGSGLARYLCSRSWSPTSVLAGLLLSSGLISGLAPGLFRLMTGGMGLLAPDKGWLDYMVTVWGLGLAVIVPPGIVLGAIFPFLMRISEKHMESAGWTIGKLAAVNTTGAIIGSIAAGFFLLDVIGLWGSLWLVAVLYLAAGIWIILRAGRHPVPLVAAGLFLAVVTWTYAAGNRSLVQLEDPRDTIVHLDEGVHGTVAVIDRGGDFRLKVNNSYLLGTSGSAINLRFMSWIPLTLHPDPASVFYLGMGTGITASGALDWPVDRIIITELIPEVITADRDYFGPWLNGLFTDPRVRIHPADGRNFLFASRDSFDVVISDMFLTHRAGVGSLYSQEHFRAVHERLSEGGIFAQWLPVFELSEEEFEIIAATMREVFGEVHLWRRGFSPEFPVMMLLGRKNAGPLDPEMFERNVARLREYTGLSKDIWFFNIPYAAYAGNIEGLGNRLDRAPINRDDRPVIEYMAPKIERERHSASRPRTMSWVDLGTFSGEILAGLPPADDPFLERLNPEQRNQVWAGLAYYRYTAAQQMGLTAEAAAFLADYQRALGLD